LFHGERPTLDWLSIVHAATSLGCTQGMFEKTLDYVKQRRLYGKDQSKLQPVSYLHAHAYAQLTACCALLCANACSFDNGIIEPVMGNICKARIGDTVFEICARLL
jgi:alkylation response protein AidB-like acyl-CoA dehydrogenase